MEQNLASRSPPLQKGVRAKLPHTLKLQLKELPIPLADHYMSTMSAPRAPLKCHNFSLYILVLPQ